jgi:hypothetical protein
VWDFLAGLSTALSDGGVSTRWPARRDRLFRARSPVLDGLPAVAGGRSRRDRARVDLMEYADFADWEPLLGGQGPVGAYVAGLSQERRQRIEERVRLSYLSGAPDGPRSMTATAWAVRGIVP